MHIESSVTAVSWIPAGSITGLARVPFSLGLTHYDQQPPARLDQFDLEQYGQDVREINRLEAWIDVRDGRIVDAGYAGPGGFIGSTRLDMGFTQLVVPGRERPVLRRQPVVSARSARFIQTVGGRTGMPFPRLTARAPFMAWHSSTAWTTLVLSLDSDGREDAWLLGASPFPRHFLYDHQGRLIAETTSTNFRTWFARHYGMATPWGGHDREPLALREILPQPEKVAA
jgi:hypothetical protein